ncbi:MAG: heparinase II/III family protein [Gemmatimonadaceae bacterium]
MSLLISDDSLTARQVAANRGLRPLSSSLAADLAALLDRDVFIPDEKALLSREGGRCARDGTLLAFDPFQPHEHRCPLCGEVYRGDLHYRFWIYWYQLWLAERAVHASVLSALGVDDRFARLAETILDGYVDRYDKYPNVDNVLGPTRLFFSTYLESIWLLQICAATELLSSNQRALASRVRDRIIAPSRAIIAEYNEGASNRQVWNAVALLASSRLLGDAAAAEGAVHGKWGIAAHLDNGLLPDGTWFEGENYHLFAHRGLWYGVTMAEVAGLEISQALLDRFQLGFSTPFATALPDVTLPSRRDSQYRISLRQWRIAEHCELGFARAADPVLGGALARLYEDDVPRRITGRAVSSADAERNSSESSLTRADLSWRALLCARENLPHLEPLSPRSTLLPSQGIAVFRRNCGRSYVALDFGHSGGGHGHPDRLNLLLADGDSRWLDDSGTGSYVDPSLHWYRSTLAHNAPMIDGKSQRPVDGRLLAYDDRGAAGWVSAVAEEIAPGTRVERTIVVMSEYLVDEFAWTSDHAARVELPLHANVVLTGIPDPVPALLDGGDGLEDGFRFAHDVSIQRVAEGQMARGVATRGDARLDVWSSCDHDTDWYRATSYGPPGHDERTFRVLRTRGTAGTIRSVLCWTGDVHVVSFEGGMRVGLNDGSSHIHRRTSDGWQVELHAGEARSSIDLVGVVPALAHTTSDPCDALDAAPPIVIPRSPRRVTLALGESNYRRSEESWSGAGSPAGAVSLSWKDAKLSVEIDVAKSDLTFPAANAVNLYDNEHPDINGDSVQLFVRALDARVAWLLVPDVDSSSVRARRIDGWDAPGAIAATWSRVGGGYRISAVVSGIVPTAVDVLVNEMPRGRLRRRGQLVLGGANGEFVYLRGDRHDAASLVPVQLPDV